MNNQILKLFFHHDLRLNDLDNSSSSNADSFSIEDFMKPDPTYSRLYFSGSDLDQQQFGLSTLSSFEDIVSALDTGFGDVSFLTGQGEFSSFSEALANVQSRECITIGGSVNSSSINLLNQNDAPDFPKVVKQALEEKTILVFKEEAQHGYNLTMLSVENIYRNFFFPLQQMLPDAFRFFSINAKRVRSERDLLFDTWTLHRPPHGFEEVFPESVL